ARGLCAHGGRNAPPDPRGARSATDLRLAGRRARWLPRAGAAPPDAQRRACVAAAPLPGAHGGFTALRAVRGAGRRLTRERFGAGANASEALVRLDVSGAGLLEHGTHRAVPVPLVERQCEELGVHDDALKSPLPSFRLQRGEEHAADSLLPVR